MSITDKILSDFLRYFIRLKKIHSKNLVHHDLHSRNILIDEKGLIADLGLCEPVKEHRKENEIYGVLPYLAPEVMSGKPYTKASDVYSFGMIIWVYTTGTEPFHDESHNIRELMFEIIN